MKNKKYVFEGSEDDYARLKIRLRYDGITQGNFFRLLVNLYIENHPTMVEIIREYKKLEGKQGIKKIERNTKDIKKGRELKEQLNLTEAEKNRMFDLIEKEKF